jgi:hypothetical protein
MPEGTETGIKWWMRYVVVPILGGGGIIAMIIAVIQRPTPSGLPVVSQPLNRIPTVAEPSKSVEKVKDAPRASQKKPRPDPNIGFYAISENSGIQRKGISVVLGETVTFYWSVDHRGDHLTLECGQIERAPGPHGETAYIYHRTDPGSKTWKNLASAGKQEVEVNWDFYACGLSDNVANVGYGLIEIHGVPAN